jgi:3-keto-5-aminohexanoate cleavage enzyme
MRKVIISLAPIPGPAAPISISSITEDIVKSIDAGAGMCHIHCKDKEGVLTPDISVISELFEQITAKRDVVVQASTGGISNMNIAERCNPLNYPKVESASLNGGSTNLGEAVYINSFDDIRYCAKTCYEKQILPEIEVFDIGMINNVNIVRKEYPFRDPVLFNLVFGHKGGIQPTVEALSAFRSFVPNDCLWGVTHFNRDNWTFLAAAIAMGATVVRIGFEDSPYLDENTDAEHNYQVVEKLVNLIRAMGLEPATPKEAREILKIVPKL